MRVQVFAVTQQKGKNERGEWSFSLLMVAAHTPDGVVSGMVRWAHEKKGEVKPGIYDAEFSAYPGDRGVLIFNIASLKPVAVAAGSPAVTAARG